MEHPPPFGLTLVGGDNRRLLLIPPGDQHSVSPYSLIDSHPGRGHFLPVHAIDFGVENLVILQIRASNE